MDYREFSAKIKGKYPQYSDMDDRELAQKMVAKYPQYSDVSFGEAQPAPTATAAAEPEPPRSIGGQLWQNLGDRVQNIADAVMVPGSVQAYSGASKDVMPPTVAGEKLQRISGQAGLALQDVGNALYESAGATYDRLAPRGLKYAVDKAGQVGGKIMEPVKRKLGEAVAPIYEKWEGLPEGEKELQRDRMGMVLGALDIAGIGGASRKIGSEVTQESVEQYGRWLAKEMAEPKGIRQAVGDKITEIGKGFKKGDLKIRDSVAKKGYGKDLIEKKNNIVNDIVEFGLTEGNFQNNAAKAMQLVEERFNKADEIVKTVSAAANAPKIDPIKAALKDIDLTKMVDADELESAQKFVDQVVKGMESQGFVGELTIDKVVAAKQSLNNRGKLFLNAVGQTDDDALKQAIKKKMYLNIVDEIGEKIPEIKVINTEAKRLLDAHAALDGAASRTANRDAMSLTDWIAGTAGTAAAFSNPGSLAISAPLFVAKKMSAGGRGSNAIVNLGRKISGRGARSIDDALAAVPMKVDDVTEASIGNRDVIETAAKEAVTNYDIPAYQRQGRRLIDPRAESAANRFGESLGGRGLPQEAPIIQPSEEMADRLRVNLERLSGEPRAELLPNRQAISAFDPKVKPIAEEYADRANKLLKGYPESTLADAKKLLQSVGADISEMSDLEIIEKATRVKGNIGTESKSLLGRRTIRGIQ